MKKSTVPLPDAGLGLFASRKNVKGDVARNFYGSLFYPNTIKEWQTMKTYRKCVMQVTAKTFRNLANELQEKLVGKDKVAYKVWIASALSRAM